LNQDLECGIRKRTKVNLFINTEITNLKKKSEQEAVKECIHRPEIHCNMLKYDTLKANEVVNDPESYNLYIKKKQVIKNKQIEEEKKRSMTPGSGKIWKDKVTIPKEFNLELNKKYDKSSHNLTRQPSAKYVKPNLSGPNIMDLTVLVTFK
jgi:hypothetical protein